ncbi:peptidase [Pseudoalteromonas rubra]|uniref:Peptidase n=1 Tax=Pseudoalteromonas rubra TaxID=43658 RepID=A0A5S3UVW5_9GAMM|nr:M4 family metallopeptidase [Pseudoalteromonas rubra]QPB85745.1 peptidase [Pseudoalteromonas rubra]
MTRLSAVLGAGAVTLFSTQAAASIESQALLNQQHLWSQLPTAAQSEHTSLNTKAQFVGTALTYRLEKAVGDQPKYEHYQAYYQGKPILDSQLIIARDMNGNVIQSMGKLLSGQVELTKQATVLKPDLKASVARHYQDNHTIIRGSTAAYLVVNGKLLDVTVVEVNRQGIAEQLVVDSAQGTVIRHHSRASFFSKETVSANTVLDSSFVPGGGIGGNDKLGAICYSPQPDSMQACTTYKYDEFTPTGQRLLFTDTNPNAIFAQFGGYPLIVKKELDSCTLENPYLSTFDARNSDTSPVSYSCGEKNENFDATKVTGNFDTWFTYSHASEAHFNAGVVMQYFHNQFAHLYPNQSSDCSTSGYCLKPLKQKVHSNTIFGTNKAFWDGEFVNYGSGDGYYFYSQATLSIAAHEIGHAITNWNSGIGAEGVDGAINEGFSDLVTIAVMDYFQNQASGAYSQSEYFTKQFTEQAGQYGQNRKWWFGWDAIYADQGVRFYELPSWDGTSIDHVADFSTGKTEHANGGVLRKAFYELVKTKQWSIQDAFKVFLRAQTAGCMFPNMSMDEYGYCLAEQTAFIEIAGKNADQRKADVSDVLLGVGIVADSNLSTLDANTRFSYNEVSYDISHLATDTIAQIHADWGDGTSSTWRKSDNQPIYPFLQQSHALPLNVLARAAVEVQFSDNNTKTAYRHFFSRLADVNCPPYQNSPQVHTGSLSIATHEISNIIGEYTSEVGARIPLARKRNYTLGFDKDLSGKKLTVLFDSDKDGEFAYTEKLIGNETISGNSATFSLNSSIPAGIGLMRIAISDDKYSYIHSCGVVDAGQVIDVMIDADSPNLPIIADFSYQILEGNKVQFINNSAANQAKQPGYSWQFGFDNQTSSDENPVIQFPENGGTFNISLTTRYQDGSDSDSNSQVLTLQPVSSCSASITDPSNAGVLYIDKLTFNYYSTVLHEVTGVAGYNASGYNFTALSDFSRSDNSYLTVVGSTNFLPRATIDNLYGNNQIGARFTVWLDKNHDDTFSKDEGHNGSNDYNYDYYTTDCHSRADGIEYCRVTSSKIIRLPWVSRDKLFTLRAKFEENPQHPLKQDACKSFTYGEVEDIQFKITRW